MPPFFFIPQDGLIGRDELLLMLNQVPRTLLNIGIEPMDRSAFDSSSLFLDGESKTTTGGYLDAASAMMTPRVGIHHGGDDFFGRGADDGAPPSMSSARGRRRGGGGASVAGGYLTPPGERAPTSTFTNQGIADQALKEFGEGSVSITVWYSSSGYGIRNGLRQASNTLSYLSYCCLIFAFLMVGTNRKHCCLKSHFLRRSLSQIFCP